MMAVHRAFWPWKTLQYVNKFTLVDSIAFFLILKRILILRWSFSWDCSTLQLGLCSLSTSCLSHRLRLGLRHAQQGWGGALREHHPQVAALPPALRGAAAAEALCLGSLDVPEVHEDLGRGFLGGKERFFLSCESSGSRKRVMVS